MPTGHTLQELVRNLQMQVHDLNVQLENLHRGIRWVLDHPTQHPKSPEPNYSLATLDEILSGRLDARD